MARFGFLFNHDQTHQIAHSLPIALELAKMRPHDSIVLATGNARISAAVRALLPDGVPANITFTQLRPRRLTRALDALLGRFVPVRKLLAYRDNLPFFKTLDTLVVSEKTSLALKTRYRLKDLRIVHTRHGAGDRAIGFDPASRGFDHVLCSGAKIKRRLVEEVGLAPPRVSIVGYPKFDLHARARGEAHLPFETGGRTVVLYNPHPSPKLSSWFRHGGEVLRFFAQRDDYFLIFAPHVMLFERPWVVTISPPGVARPGAISQEVARAPNIHVDLGSAASSDMSYTNAADLYLGDVSSQLYEFLYTPRPCLFLNSHGVNWRHDPNYAHWHAGPVIASPTELEKGLALARASHQKDYAMEQKHMFEDSFDLTNEPSSVRAARAIAGLAEGRKERIL